MYRMMTLKIDQQTFCLNTLPNNKQVPKSDQNVNNAKGASRSAAFPGFVCLVDKCHGDSTVRSVA